MFAERITLILNDCSLHQTLTTLTSLSGWIYLIYIYIYICSDSFVVVQSPTDGDCCRCQRQMMPSTVRLPTTATGTRRSPPTIAHTSLADATTRTALAMSFTALTRVRRYRIWTTTIHAFFTRALSILVPCQITVPQTILVFVLPATKKWHRPTVTGEIPGARDGHSACVINNRMFVFGGYEEGVRINFVFKLLLLLWCAMRH